MPYNGPQDTITAVLKKLGITPQERLDEFDQDAEYTACRADELSSYFLLYQSRGLSADERDVLCCFLLESLNELIQNGIFHPQQSDIIQTLFEAGNQHADELEYWMDTSEANETYWWPITKVLLQAKAWMSQCKNKEPDDKHASHD